MKGVLSSLILAIPVLVWPQGYKKNSCSAQLSMNFFLLINVKMPTNVNNCWHFNIYEQEK